jgi:hypothetical protein
VEKKYNITVHWYRCQKAATREVWRWPGEVRIKGGEKMEKQYKIYVEITFLYQDSERRIAEERKRG